DHVDEHLLVLGRGQVEHAPGRRGAGASAGPPPLAGGGEDAARGGRRTEAAAGDREHGSLGVPTDSEAVEELALGQPVHRGHRVSERVATVAAGDSERVRGPAGGGHGETVTLSYSRRRGRYACLRSHALGG